MEAGLTREVAEVGGLLWREVEQNSHGFYRYFFSILAEKGGLA